MPSALIRVQRHAGTLGLAACVLLYLAISLRHLDTIPVVHEDEPWQASTSWKLATEGVFGTDLFAGFSGMERRYYGFMPLHPLLQAAVFRVAGLGLWQARLETVLLGLATLVLTYGLGRRLFGARVGLLAVVLLLTARTTALSASHVTGVLFLDVARVARYDMAVPVFGLAALHAYLTALRREARRWYVAAGALTGLAGLAHLYGLFWLPALGVLALWDGRGQPLPRTLGRAGMMAAGCALPWLPYGAFVLADLPSWRGQTRGYAERFELLSLGWYAENVRREPLRYAPGLAASWHSLGRVGLWTALTGLPLALGALLRRGLSGDGAARALVVPGLLFPALFALLLHLKLSNYLVAIAPVWALVGAWGGLRLWDRLALPAAGGRLVGRAALALLLAAVLVEGSARVAALERAAATATAYDDLIARVRGAIPQGSRVLGLHTFWLGLESFDYRSFLVPVFWSHPAHAEKPLTFGEGVELIAPDVVLIDPQMRAFFGGPEHGGRRAGAELQAWLQRHDAVLIERIDDPTYGLIELYRVRT